MTSPDLIAVIQSAAKGCAGGYSHFRLVPNICVYLCSSVVPNGFAFLTTHHSRALSVVEGPRIVITSVIWRDTNPYSQCRVGGKR